MDATQTVERMREAVSSKTVFGEPYEKNGVTVIPAASVKGGGGGGEGEAPEGQGKGTGSGFGLSAHPTGAFVIEGNQVTWRPAFDRNRAFALSALVALALIWTVGRIAKARATAHPHD